MDYVPILRAFGFALETDAAPASLTHFAPVFRLIDAERSWVVKRTQTPPFLPNIAEEMTHGPSGTFL